MVARVMPWPKPPPRCCGDNMIQPDEFEDYWICVWCSRDLSGHYEPKVEEPWITKKPELPPPPAPPLPREVKEGSLYVAPPVHRKPELPPTKVRTEDGRAVHAIDCDMDEYCSCGASWPEPPPGTRSGILPAPTSAPGAGKRRSS
jgi:hypothetical protein